MARAVWLYYMCKIIELLDTVFFVLRKKQNQISFLHLYHHTLMPFCGFIGVKYFAGKQQLFARQPGQMNVIAAMPKFEAKIQSFVRASNKFHPFTSGTLKSLPYAYYYAELVIALLCSMFTIISMLYFFGLVSLCVPNVRHCSFNR